MLATTLPAPVPLPPAGDLRTMLRAGSGSFGWMGTWPGGETWFSADGDHAVVFRAVRGVALVVGGPAGPVLGAAAAAREFASHAARRGLVAAFWAADPVLAPALGPGWRSVSIGSEAVVDPAAFSLRGRCRRDVRASVNRAGRLGVRVVHATWTELDAVRRARVAALVHARRADRRLPELGFTLGGVAELADPAVRLALAEAPGGQVLAVTSWLPVHRGRALRGLTLDVMARAPGSPNGLVEALIADVLLTCPTGVEAVSLSVAPLAGDLPLLLVGVRRVLEPWYGFRSLAAFKDKFGPAHRPLALVVPGARDLPAVAHAVLTAYVGGPLLPALAVAGRPIRRPATGATLAAC